MAITHINTAVSSNTTAGTTLTVTMPTFAEDDVVIVALAMTNSGDPATTVATAPTGWTRLDGDGVNISAISAVRLQLFYRAMQSGDGGTVDFTCGASAGFKAVASSYRGVDTSSPIDAFASDSGDGSWDPVSPRVTTTVLGTKILRIVACDANQTLTNSAVTIRNNTGGIALPGNGTNNALGDEDQYQVGDTGRSVWTIGSAEEWGTYTVALAPGTTYELGGITRDVDGDVLVSANCYLYKYDSGADTITYLDHVVSDGSTGVYLFTGIPDNDSSFLVVGTKADSPHIFDVTDHDLQPEASQSTDYDLYLRSDADKSESSPDPDLRLRSDADKVSAGTTVTPSAVSVALSVAAPTVSVGAVTASPDPVSVAVTAAQPTVTAGAVTASPDALSVVLSAVQPTVVVGVVSAYPSPVEVNIGAPDPTLVLGAVTLTPDPVGVTVGIPAPTVSLAGTTNVQPDPVSVAISPPAPSVTVGAVSAQPDPVGIEVGVPVPTLVVGAITAQPDPTGIAISTAAPVVGIGALTLTPAALVAAWSVAAPTLTVGARTVSPDPLEITITVPVPVIPGGISRTLLLSLTRSQVFDP